MEGGELTAGLSTATLTNLNTGHALSAAGAWAPAAPVQRWRKVAIVGFGKTAKDCPWQDQTWELWGMNGFWRAAEEDFGIKAAEDRYALWFDMHTLEYTREYGKRAGFGNAQVDWLKAEHPFPILMLDSEPECPHVQPYPVAKVVEKLGRDYFTSTVAYAIAFALTQDDVAEIGLWGIDLIHDTEYADQRPCAEYWIGRAEAMGLKVTIHPGSAICKQRFRYGYEEPNPLLEEMRSGLLTMRNALGQAVKDNQEKREKLNTQLHTDDGALQMVQGLLGRLEAWNRGGKI